MAEDYSSTRLVSGKYAIIFLQIIRKNYTIKRKREKCDRIKMLKAVSGLIQICLSSYIADGI